MPLDTEQLAGEAQATSNTILLVEDAPNDLAPLWWSAQM